MTQQLKDTQGSSTVVTAGLAPAGAAGTAFFTRAGWLAAAAAFGLLVGCGKPQDSTQAPSVISTNAAPASPATTGSSPPEAGFQKLVGRWLRSDGDYMLVISGVDAAGKLTAAYLNPRPINVARAEASRDGSFTKVFVELRDVNYPGSTYTLTYEPAVDQLQGIYYQAALQQQFDVIFERMK